MHIDRSIDARKAAQPWSDKLPQTPQGSGGSGRWIILGALLVGALLIGLTIIAFLELQDQRTETARPQAASSEFEWFCPMHPTIVCDNPKEKCPICRMPLSKRKRGEAKAEPLPPER